MKANVIDLSHHNIIAKDLQPAKDSGVLGVIHKLTEGTTGFDNKATARRSLSSDAGMLWGIYHFLRPGNIAKQATYFLANAEDLMDDETLLACDFEVGGISLIEVLRFLQAIEKATDRSPVLYSGHTLKELGGCAECPPLAAYRLWLSQYGPKAVLPAGYSDFWLWQFSQTGTIPGITGSVDLNYFAGTNDELKEQWSGR